MSDRSTADFWRFARESWLLAVAGIVIALMASSLVLVAWAMVMAWFGIVYLIAFTLALAILLLVPTETRGESRSSRRFLWFVAVSAIAVMLTLIYSAVNGALFSGTPIGTVVGIQLVHSLIFFIASVLVAAVCGVVRARSGPRSRRLHFEPSRD